MKKNKKITKTTNSSPLVGTSEILLGILRDEEIQQFLAKAAANGIHISFNTSYDSHPSQDEFTRVKATIYSNNFYSLARMNEPGQVVFYINNVKNHSVSEALLLLKKDLRECQQKMQGEFTTATDQFSKLLSLS